MKPGQIVYIAFMAIHSILRRILPAAGVLLCLTGFAQRTPVPTDSFIITGAVRSVMIVKYGDLAGYKVHVLSDAVIHNQKGEAKDTARLMKGILLKDILQQTEPLTEKPKQLNAFYYVCIAADNYRVVYSWNELFNSSVGDQVYLITEKDHKTGLDLPERIQMFSAGDQQKGRRFLKNLTEIRVSRAD